MSKIPEEYIHNIEGYKYIRASDLEQLNIDEGVFDKFMEGQTLFMDSTGKTCYFLRDVQRFLNGSKLFL